MEHFQVSAYELLSEVSALDLTLSCIMLKNDETYFKTLATKWSNTLVDKLFECVWPFDGKIFKISLTIF